jgi:DNA-directed RNA polymerase specialized sigma24 family protein
MGDWPLRPLTFNSAGERRFLSWLRAVMQNRWRDLCRRSAVRRCINDPEQLDGLTAANDLDGWIKADERKMVIRRALQVMHSDFEPTTWRACWEHVAVDRKAAEVAAELGVSEDVVYSASYRVIRRLRRELAGMWS